MNNDILRNKRLYKIFISLVKYLPSVLMIIQIIAIALNYLGISALLLNCVGGVSILFMVLLYFISYIFRFCYLYRIPLIYNLIVIILSVMIVTGTLPIDIMDLYRIYGIFTGVFVSLFIYLMYKNRNKPKVDYIRSFCENYCC